MIEEINSWLNSGCDYMTGAAIYERFGCSGSQKRLFWMGGPTPRNVECLKYELSKMLSDAVPVKSNMPIHRPPVEVKIVVKTPGPAPVITGRRSNTPEVDELSSHVISLMKVRDQLHATLEYVPDKQRGKDAKMILDISDEITEIYERLDHFNKHGVLPGKVTKVVRKQVSEMDTPELMKLQQNLRTYVSRYKKLMDNAKTSQKKSEHERRLNTFQLELDEVDRKLRS